MAQILLDCALEVSKSAQNDQWLVPTMVGTHYGWYPLWLVLTSVSTNRSCQSVAFFSSDNMLENFVYIDFV